MVFLPCTIKKTVDLKIFPLLLSYHCCTSVSGTLKSLKSLELEPAMYKRCELSSTPEVAAARKRLIAFCKQRKASDAFSSKRLQVKPPLALGFVEGNPTVCQDLTFHHLLMLLMMRIFLHSPCLSLFQHNCLKSGASRRKRVLVVQVCKAQCSLSCQFV